MMSGHGQRYRLKESTLAIITVDGKNHPTTIPSGAIIKQLVDGPMDGNRLVDVAWDGKTVMMFTTDLSERGVKLEEA
jgi:hypothetical protein